MFGQLCFVKGSCWSGSKFRSIPMLGCGEPLKQGISSFSPPERLESRACHNYDYFSTALRKLKIEKIGRGDSTWSRIRGTYWAGSKTFCSPHARRDRKHRFADGCGRGH